MVIQRLQSLYLIIAIALMAIFPFSPFLELSTSIGEFSISSLQIKMLGESTLANTALVQPDYSWGMFSLNALIVIFLGVTLFLYKNIKLQKQLCWINIAMIISLFSSLSIIANKLYDGLGGHKVYYNFALFLPIIAIIFIALAIRRIRTDMKTLSSYDRIR